MTRRYTVRRRIKNITNKQRREGTPRICLKCRQRFNSLGPGNRICEPCNRENESINERINVKDPKMNRGKTPA